MSMHQVVIRKDGPVHAIAYEDGEYSDVTLCGLGLTGLEHIRRRLFKRVHYRYRCGRCNTSYKKL